MGKSYKPKMLGGEIQKVVSDMLIRGDLKDPGFKGMIGVTGVDVTNDGSYATLFLTAMSMDGKDFSQEDKDGILAAFNKSKGFIRTEIGKRVKVRHTPELIFKFDTSFEYGVKMDKILDQIKKEEA